MSTRYIPSRSGTGTVLLLQGVLSFLVFFFVFVSGFRLLIYYASADSGSGPYAEVSARFPNLTLLLR